jgi:phosphatidylglycerophosphate synthase
MLVDSLSNVRTQLDCATPCLYVSGNLVVAKAQLSDFLARYQAGGSTEPLSIVTNDPEHGGTIRIGPLDRLLDGTAEFHMIERNPAGALPFALNGRPEDRDEAEERLARAVREESLNTDAVMARVFDRKLSWRLSLPLARLGIAPNAVTLANTALGGACAVMLASTSYWVRLIGALLFVVCVTIDGVDGELARLRMVESDFGGKLDVLTDNLVHIAVFIGLIVGCYRVSHSWTYVYLCIALLIGFLFCAFTVQRASKAVGFANEEWVGKVERATGRDFAYLIAVLALIDRLAWFAWGTAVGTFVFAFVLRLLTIRRSRRMKSAG